MNANLFDILVERDVINENSELIARVKRNDLSGVARITFESSFHYVGHSLPTDGSEALFVAESKVDGRISSIPISSILTIDGMEPRRIAGIYALNEKGESVKQAARRGRKPKAKVSV